MVSDGEAALHFGGTILLSTQQYGKAKNNSLPKMKTWRLLPVAETQQAFLVLKANLKPKKPGVTLPLL